MSSTADQHPTTFPTVPPSLSASNHGIRDYYATQEAQRPSPHTLPNITPYLGLRARLSQVWINKWTILLLLILARSLIAVTGLNHDLGSARREALSACSAVESMGSTMASMPHYMSQGTNEMAARGVEKAVHGLMSMLLLTITGIEELVVFYINMLTSTYLCLITFAVAGSLHIALQIADDVTKFLNTTLGDIGKDVHQGITSFSDDLNKFFGTINSLPLIGGQKSSLPSINLNGPLDKLDHLQLPPLDQGLDKLNKSIPDFAHVQNFTNNAIQLPFEEIKKLINGSLHFQFDRSVFPVPQKEQLTFCSDSNGISEFFDLLQDIADLARKIFLGVLIVAAVLACLPMMYREIRRWRTMQKRSHLVNNYSIDPMDVIYIASRPYTSDAGIKAAGAFKSPRRQILARWFVAYATSPQALFVLSLAIAGLFSCLCQYILLRAIEREVPALANQVGDFAGKVVTSLNNASEQWAIGTNRAIQSTNDNINHDVFGWVNTSTGAINNTINVFVKETSNLLNITFGGTILYDPIKEVLNCLVGLKIASIQKGLTWVHDNAHIDFPLFHNDTFSLGAAGSISGKDDHAETFLASPGSQATDKITSAVVRVTDGIAGGIRTEVIISLFILLVWIVIVLCGLIRVLWLASHSDKVRGEGGATFAGDISLEPHDHMMMHPPAPAYEPPQASTGPSAVFREPARPIHSSSSEEEGWQDQKLGFSGERGPPGRVNTMRHTRASEYGIFGNEKR